MNLQALLDQGPVVIAHTLMAIFAIVTGGLQLLMPKGTPAHRWLGRFWVLLMVIVALSSFGINDFRMLGPFSVIHLLSLLTLYILYVAIKAVRNGNIKKHARTMKQLYLLALIITGLFTLWPGRTMHQVLFGG